MEARSKWVTISLSGIALLISVTSLVFTFLAYNLEKRPYVGIVKVDYAPVGTSKVESLEWKIVFRNTGSLPAEMTVEKRRVSVRYKNKELEVRLRKMPGEVKFVIMPGGEVTLDGDYPKNDDVPVTAIITGKVTLEDHIRISYSPSSAVWWKSRYFYEATLRFESGGIGPMFSPYFTPVHAAAN